jgi:hypothetical protein
VPTRIIIGLGAWLVGAAGATGGSLLAVSLLGQGIISSPGQQLSVGAVNRALASEAAESPEPSASTPVPGNTAGDRARARHRAPHHRTPHHRPETVSSPQPTGAVFTSAGGTVVARCDAAGAYLLSWSPQQGYEVMGVLRGPSATANVTFRSAGRAVTMTLSCVAGAPSERTNTGGSWIGGDD